MAHPQQAKSRDHDRPIIRTLFATGSRCSIWCMAASANISKHECGHTRLSVRHRRRSYRPHRPAQHMDVAAPVRKIHTLRSFCFPRILLQNIATRPLGHKLQQVPGIVSHVTILSSLIMQTSGGGAHTGTKEQMNTHVAMPYQLSSLHEIPREPCSRSASCNVKRDAPATRLEEEALPSRIHARLRAMRCYLMRTA